MPGASCPIDILADRATASAFIVEHTEAIVRNGAVLGLDIGRELVPVYREWTRRHREAGLSFRGVTSFGLGEYEGLGRGDPRSCTRVVDESLLSTTNIGRSLAPPGLYRDAGAEAAAYERQIKAMGGIDLLLLGIGPGGRLVFNEPGSAGDSRARRVALGAGAREEASTSFGGPDQAPTHALTAGIGTLLAARKIVVVGWGSASAARVRRALQEPVGPAYPASFLQLHGNVRAVLAEVGGVWG